MLDVLQEELIMPEVVALIPARGGSKGVPKKNIRLFLGKPLISYAIETALGCRMVDRVIVSSDSKEIAAISKQYGAEIPFIRPKNLALDTTPDQPVIQHAIREANLRSDDLIVFLRPTSVMRDSEIIDKAILRLIDEPRNTSVRTINHAQYSPYWMKKIGKESSILEPFIVSDYALRRRQELPEVWQANGVADILRSCIVMQSSSMYGDFVGYYKTDNICSMDIDDELDFLKAEVAYKYMVDQKILIDKGRK